MGSVNNLLEDNAVHFKSISEWLEWIKSLHPVEMDLSLERVREVAGRLNLLAPSYTVITVAGTNGKGSCVAGLEAMYLAAGYRVGAFTSPYLFSYNEQVRLQGNPVQDALFCQAFEKIVMAAADITLTPFEFTALAALLIFQQANLEIGILEVGLGGRWDAVNVMDAAIAVVASIDIDHAAVLGDTREKIGREKAGIFRADRPVVCGDIDPPLSLVNYANELHAPLFCQGKQFTFQEEQAGWCWQSEKNKLEHLPLPVLALQNMATVLMVIELLAIQHPVERSAIDQALVNIKLPGRIQIIPGEVTQIFDVSHNPAAAKLLITKLRQQSYKGKHRAVFSMLADKDIVTTIQVMTSFIDEWFIAPLPVPRGASQEVLIKSFQKAGVKAFEWHSSIANAFKAAKGQSKAGDCIVIFGSFHTVSAAMQQEK